MKIPFLNMAFKKLPLNQNFCIKEVYDKRRSTKLLQKRAWYYYLAYKSQHNENDYPDNHLDYNTPPQVCPSCRAFFRRSVQSGYNSTYFCVKDGSCQVDDFDNFDERDIGSGICVDDCITAPTFVSEWPFADNLSVFKASSYMYVSYNQYFPRSL